MKLVQMLAEGRPAGSFDHAASVLTNVARHPVGRRVFLDHGRRLVAAAMPSMASSAPDVRRIGVAAALHNCCVDEASRAALLTIPTAPGAAAGGNAAEVAVVGFG